VTIRHMRYATPKRQNFKQALRPCSTINDNYQQNIDSRQPTEEELFQQQFRSSHIKRV